MKKYTVITGASSGIGYATAKAFAVRNKNLILMARRQSNMEQLRDDILYDFPNLDIVIYPVDLSDTYSCRQAYHALQTYSIETWINNAGIGVYGGVAEHDLSKIQSMLHVNIEALTILSSLYVHDYIDVDGTQLINISSAGGYTIVKNAVAYCASKFYVSAFTEGLAQELKSLNAKMKVKLFAPFLTETEFAGVANNIADFIYTDNYKKFHTSDEAAKLLLELYDSNEVVGLVSRDNFAFSLTKPLFNHAEPSK